MASNIAKTLACVAVAGVLFIAAVYYGVKPLFLVAAFFDWLPLPTGWMRVSEASRSPLAKRAGAVHGVVTAIAYAIGVAWLIVTDVGGLNLGFTFLEAWFLAVITGAYATSIACSG